MTEIHYQYFISCSGQQSHSLRRSIPLRGLHTIVLTLVDAILMVPQVKWCNSHSIYWPEWNVLLLFIDLPSLEMWTLKMSGRSYMVMSQRFTTIFPWSSDIILVLPLCRVEGKESPIPVAFIPILLLDFVDKKDERKKPVKKSLEYSGWKEHVDQRSVLIFSLNSWTVVTQKDKDDK